MSTRRSTNLKKQARALSAELGISHQAARNLILAGNTPKQDTPPAPHADRVCIILPGMSDEVVDDCTMHDHEDEGVDGPYRVFFGTCPGCDQPRPYPVYEDEPNVFLPGSECPNCGHVEADFEHEAGDELTMMDSEGTITHIDGADYKTVVGIDEGEWEAFAAPLKVDKWLVQAAVDGRNALDREFNSL